MTARHRSQILCVVLGALLMTSGAAHAAVLHAPFVPEAWPDARGDAEAGAADLRSVSFGQRETELWLKVRAQQPWAVGEERVCVVLQRGGPAGSLCVAGDGRGAPVLRFRDAPVPAVIVRPDERSLFVRFHPHAARLPFGRYRWAVETAGDRAPDPGARTLRVSAFGAPPCFGAAARAGRRSCVNRALRRAVIPSPRAAAVSPDALCRRPRGTSPWRVIEPCDFGSLDEPGAPEVALVGDSHSAHWRAAVDVVAQARGWRAVSITHPGCALSIEVYPAIRARCRTHAAEALRWLREHPTVHTVFTSSSAGRGFGTAGFLALWRSLPATVKRIVVLRDIPRVSFRTASCVMRARRRHRPTARVCAVARAGAFPADPSAVAARAPGDRARLVDLTRHFCDRTRCYPVVGGAYVYRDDNHMNAVFSATLGPYLLRAL